MSRSSAAVVFGILLAAISAGSGLLILIGPHVSASIAFVVVAAVLAPFVGLWRSLAADEAALLHFDGRSQRIAAPRPLRR